MSHVTLNISTWSEARFVELCTSLRVPHALAVGVITMVSGRTRLGGLDVASRQELVDLMPVDLRDRDAWFEALHRCGYIQSFANEGYVVEGNARYFAVVASRRAAGRARQAQRRAQDSGKPSATAKRVKLRGSTVTARKARFHAWRIYSDEYQARYHMQPPRNRHTNTEIADFVSRIGHVDSPSVIQFYVRHHSLEYIHSMHSIRLMLRDAEALKAQWRRGEAINARLAVDEAVPRAMRQASLWGS